MTQPQVYTQDFHGIPATAVDADARMVVQRLREQGFDAYIVGGAVRDLLIKRQPKDFDIATSATPEQIRKVFRNSRIIGRRFRLAHVFFKNHKIVEVSTFRREPIAGATTKMATSVETTNNYWGVAEDDAVRRDLTINGFFLDPEQMTVIDYNNGMQDLRACRIRMIGDPRQRFQEDPVRMIRAIRHAARTGFLIEDRTWAAICELGHLIRECNESRVRQEFIREFQEGAAARSVKMLQKSGLLKHLLPHFAEFLDNLNSRPEQKRVYWKLLRLLDKEGASKDLPAPLIFATALGPAIVPNLLTIFLSDERVEINLIHGELATYMAAVGIPKALTEPLAQALAAQPKLDKARKNGDLPGKLRNKSYFGLAMHLFVLRHQAIGSWIPEAWEELLPADNSLSQERGRPDQRKDGGPSFNAKEEHGPNHHRPRSDRGDHQPTSSGRQAQAPTREQPASVSAANENRHHRNAGNAAAPEAGNNNDTRRRKRRRGRRGGGNHNGGAASSGIN